MNGESFSWNRILINRWKKETTNTTELISYANTKVKVGLQWILRWITAEISEFILPVHETNLIFIKRKAWARKRKGQYSKKKKNPNLQSHGEFLLKAHTQARSEYGRQIWVELYVSE